MATHRIPFHNSREIPFTVEAQGRELENSYDHAVRRIVASTLGRFTERVRAIRIWLEDVNGPRGGEDIRCRIEGHLHPKGSINVSALAVDEYAAIARAAARARQVVDRRRKKIRSRRRDLIR